MSSHQCRFCDRTFDTAHGAKVHGGTCRKKAQTQPVMLNPVQGEPPDKHAIPKDPTIIMPDIPSYQKVDIIPKSQVNGHEGADFTTLINDVYNKIIKWRKNLFKLPTGNAAKAFIS